MLDGVCEEGKSTADYTIESPHVITETRNRRRTPDSRVPYAREMERKCLLAERAQHGARRSTQVSSSDAGSSTIKRVPAIRAPSGRRFSASMVPPWASTICFEMFKPNPEWVPSFSPAGRLTPEAPGPVCNSCESVHGKGSKAGPRVPYGCPGPQPFRTR